MTEFARVPIGDLGRVVTGKTPSSSQEGEYGAYMPFLTPSDISWSDKYPETDRFLSEQGATRLKRVQLPAKAVATVCIGATIGKVAFTTATTVTNQQINSVVVDEKEYCPEYVYYLFTTLRPWLENYAGGAATPIINKSAFSSIKLPFPKQRDIQRKIAAVLTAYDDLIENNRQRIALLEKMAEEIYREWFVRLRFPGHEYTPIRKGVPEGWAQAKLADISDMVFGQSPPSEFYNEVGDGLPFHQGVGSYGDRYPHHTTFCSVDGRKAKAESILFSVRAPVGRINITDREVILGRGLVGLNERKSRNGYLFQLLKSHFSREDLIGNGAIFASVSKKELEGFPVFMPAEKLVDRFEELITPIDQQIDNLHQSSALLSQTRNLLLNRLISGKLRVDDLDIAFPPSMTVDAEPSAAATHGAPECV